MRRLTPLLGRLALAGLLVSIALGRADAQARSDDEVRQLLRAYREQHEASILREFTEFLALRNLASDSATIRQNAYAIVAMLAKRGIESRLLESPGSPPAVWGELTISPTARTVILYAHYDGQPVDTARWVTQPWRPTLRSRALFDGGKEIPLPRDGERIDPEARIYARSASDDKAPIVAVLSALDALRAAHIQPSVNLKLFLDGEEEAGSSHMAAMLTAHKDLLASDGWLFLDGPVHQSRQAQIVYGVRGDMGLNLTVYGSKRPLHSGHYGNWAPNPIAMLVHLLASMRDASGHITIAGYYDNVRPLSDAERRAFASVPPVEQQLKAELGLAEAEGGDGALAERLALPAFNMSGIAGGGVGAKGSNTIVSEAKAFVDLRLVPDQQPEGVKRLIEAHLERMGYHVVHEAPDSLTRRRFSRIVNVEWGDGYAAVRVSPDHPFARAVTHGLEAALGHSVIQVPTLGGSLPLAPFEAVLHPPLVVLPMANHDNNQHAENENLRVQNMWDAIEMFGGLIVHLGREWTAHP